MSLYTNPRRGRSTPLLRLEVLPLGGGGGIPCPLRQPLPLKMALRKIILKSFLHVEDLVV